MLENWSRKQTNPFIPVIVTAAYIRTLIPCYIRVLDDVDLLGFLPLLFGPLFLCKLARDERLGTQALSQVLGAFGTSPRLLSCKRK